MNYLFSFASVIPPDTSPRIAQEISIFFSEVFTGITQKNTEQIYERILEGI